MDNLSPRKIQNIIDSRDRLKKRWEQSKDKYTKLEKEYELLKANVNNHYVELCNKKDLENKKLKDELKSLKYQLELTEQQNTRNTEIFKECLEENNKLKDENEQLKEKLEETTKLKDEFLNRYKEKTQELVRLVPRTKRGLDARNSRGY